ncbi:glutamine--fructose-6-phosphate transaminase [Sulfuricella denitrificans skB26]|uniref:Glutamine--fructose-6-phosphate aminotransferase [isomerizing] n=1 Tax=Sulfuricella denitrificans (strain DSM 22764 / NBRC 105220 / skB26) TaxID=1163617 RepID=S6AKA5_SULDS|nr:glutamine--fructose-6-phosphate transaminase (isomerizing) [Sulfuricella denitrificans]BAN36816.1 glutamine--fructose-6-phosphate transaminase [Sulfuricella denitrificans skB26]
MCGIIGAVAQRNVVPILLEGLRRLEYRGYDSAGLAVSVNGGLTRVRKPGRVAELEAEIKIQKTHGNLGIAHTRWATHGVPSERNAHPHVSEESLAVVHNGIIENHEALRQRLSEIGYHFTSDTDTEVIVHLIHFHFHQEKDLFQATRKAVTELKGTYAIGVICAAEPNRLVCAREGSPLLIGVGIEEHFIASDVSALLPVTQKVVYLEEGDVADIGLLDFRIVDRSGMQVSRPVQISELSADRAELGGYRHYMQKEIFEQPRALAETLEEALSHGDLNPTIFGDHASNVLSAIDSVTIIACGTSYHAAMVARYWIESVAGIPCNAEVASEYRYRDSVPNPNALIVTISQSGETADTLAALKHAKSLGHVHSLSICNAPESALVRESGLRFLTRAGPEIGVASTKAFTTQLTALLLLALVLGKLRGRISAAQETAHLDALRHLPAMVNQVLLLEPQIELWAERMAFKQHALFLGRGLHYPIAMEGALKLKEISYIHAEAYPAGELKHGPLALVDSDMPVVAIAPNDALLEKLKSNLQEVRARGGELYVLADQDSQMQAQEDVHLIKLPEHAGLLSPILHTVPLQLLAYHAALQKGTDVDKPRNLAKSVTVE